MSDKVLFFMDHVVCKFHTQNGEEVTGCVCQIRDDSIDIQNGKISRLGEKNEFCFHKE